MQEDPDVTILSKFSAMKFHFAFPSFFKTIVPLEYLYFVYDETC